MCYNIYVHVQINRYKNMREVFFGLRFVSWILSRLSVHFTVKNCFRFLGSLMNLIGLSRTWTFSKHRLTYNNSCGLTRLSAEEKRRMSNTNCEYFTELECVVWFSMPRKTKYFLRIIYKCIFRRFFFRETNMIFENCVVLKKYATAARTITFCVTQWLKKICYD